MIVPVTNAVREQAKKCFSPDVAELIISVLESTELPLIANNSERVHLALLHLSQGDLAQFERHLSIATTDWRDTLVAGGLAHSNWREVLRERGIEISQS